jgi:hypothetical protein
MNKLPPQIPIRPRLHNALIPQRIRNIRQRPALLQNTPHLALQIHGRIRLHEGLHEHEAEHVPGADALHESCGAERLLVGEVCELGDVDAGGA